MQEHDSKPQNPIIANVLYKSKILESWGRGIGTMVDECKRVGLPAPEFNTDGNFVWGVFKFNRSSVVNTQQATQQATQQVQELIWLRGDYPWIDNLPLSPFGSFVWERERGK